MSQQIENDGFSPMEEVPEPLGPRRPRLRGRGRPRGCLVVALVLVALGVGTCIYCGVKVKRSVVRDPARVEAIARATFAYELPPGFTPEVAVSLPGILDVAVFEHGEGDAQTMLGFGAFPMQMDEDEAMEAFGSASGRGDIQIEEEVEVCEVAARKALCFGGVTQERTGRARWQAVFVSVDDGSRMALVLAPETLFDEELVQRFFGSLKLP